MAIIDRTKEIINMEAKLEKCEREHDNVNHPKHYNNSPATCECGRRIECIDVTRHMDFDVGNAVKYLWRFLDKGGLEDLKKARWYLEDKIKQMEQDNDLKNNISE